MNAKIERAKKFTKLYVTIELMAKEQKREKKFFDIIKDGKFSRIPWSTVQLLEKHIVCNSESLHLITEFFETLEDMTETECSNEPLDDIWTLFIFSVKGETIKHKCPRCWNKYKLAVTPRPISINTWNENNKEITNFKYVCVCGCRYERTEVIECEEGVKYEP